MMSEETPEKSYQEARQEALRRFEKSLSLEVQKRVDFLPGSTVECLTANIGDPHLRRHSADTLKFLKMVGSLRLLLQLGVLDREEHEELDQYISNLHKKMKLEMGEENNPAQE